MMLHIYKYTHLAVWLAVAFGSIGSAAEPQSPTAPRVSDPRLEVVRFAMSPDIVHPISLDFDRRGRLLVIESHTHFRPAQYEGPAHDRIRVVEDTDGDGKADRFTTFFEGTDFTMDVAAHPDGSVYVASRSEILRLRDTDGDGAADRRERLVHLDTKGNYPHNGLSGLAFDFRGDLLFGMGENLGASYKLIGADGVTLSDEGEGGNVFACTAAGKRLRRVATGFWNPFGVTVDVFGRTWAVDNDPDAMPPCRLLHVIEGGDYGYQFRYGRSGRHPFQAWNGQLAGTLPMASGTGEAPCEVISYESDGLPAEYRGDLFVTSWADHRVERYVLKPRGASYVAERKPFVQGDTEFRPVGLAVAPDGSMFTSDWVRRDYALHHQGAIWHIRPRAPAKGPRPDDLRQAIQSLHRPLREAAARKLAADPAGREFLREQLRSRKVRVRATALEALIDVPEAREELRTVGAADPDTALRAHAIGLLVSRGDFPNKVEAAPGLVWLSILSAIPTGSMTAPTIGKILLVYLGDDDPFLRSAAIRQLALSPQLLAGIGAEQMTTRQRQGLLLAQRAAGPESADNVARWLDDTDEEVRFLAVKWVADRRLAELRPRIEAALQKPDLSVRMYQAYATALSRIDGQEVSDAKLADHFVGLLEDRKTPAARLVSALRLVPASHKRLTVTLLARLLASDDATLRREAVRKLAQHPDGRRFEILQAVAHDAANDEGLRADALVGVAAQFPSPIESFVKLALEGQAPLRDEALRALTGEKLNDEQRDKLADLGTREPVGPLVQRVLGRPTSEGRPQATDLAGWLARLEGPADADAGRRVFFHPKLAGCFRCHRADGNGQEIGPDLSVIGRTERRHLLESIVQPSNLVPPHYQVWQLELNDGRTLHGMLVRTVLDEYTYVDPQGKLFQVRTVDIVDSNAAPVSIMPAGMVDRLTDQELRDLLAFLGQRGR